MKELRENPSERERDESRFFAAGFDLSDILLADMGEDETWRRGKSSLPLFFKCRNGVPFHVKHLALPIEIFGCASNFPQPCSLSLSLSILQK